jgi:tetratricopeptide (TPR) repeat protein
MPLFAVIALLACPFLGVGQTTVEELQAVIKVHPNDSLAHYRLAAIRLSEGSYMDAANHYRSALDGNLEPRWVEVWSRISLGKIYDATGQRERAILQYRAALRTKDDTDRALQQAAKYITSPYVPQ